MIRKIRGGFLLLAFAAVLVSCAGRPVYATEPSQDDAAASGESSETDSEEELTPEEALKKELDTVYQMEVQSNSWKNWPEGPGTYGEAAIVMDAGTGAILYAKNIDAHHYPASITKVLTTLVALQNGSLADPVSFSHESVAFLKPDESSIGMKEGNQLTLEQALYATLLASANEVAYAVGENVGTASGHDYTWFIEEMNGYVRSWAEKILILSIRMDSMIRIIIPAPETWR